MTPGTLVYVDRPRGVLSREGEQGEVIEVTTRHRKGSPPSRAVLVQFRDGSSAWLDPDPGPSLRVTG